MAFSAPDQEKFMKLFKGGVIPLQSSLPGLTLVLHDYFITLEDEINYVWIRYYGIALLMFDVTQIHLFKRPGITNDNVCVAMDSIIRIVGAFLLWLIKIVMQLRIYALFNCSLRIAAFNFALFLASIGGFMRILIYNAVRRREIIAGAMKLPLPGCPPIHIGIEWMQWIPATVFEVVLFGWVIYRTALTTIGSWKRGSRISLCNLVLRDNILYFFGITCLLVFNNLMVAGVTKIPWFSYS
ncbi:hypothetical protein BDQ17DRAFT_1334881 [Cyathus striatus]|nr:hypothetical protein BDQ17DRAFT_1334881 [Cyathus striatus]